MLFHLHTVVSPPSLCITGDVHLIYSTSNPSNRYSFYADPRYHDYHRSTSKDALPYYSVSQKRETTFFNPPVRADMQSSSPPQTFGNYTTVVPPPPVNSTGNSNGAPRVPPHAAHTRYASYDSAANMAGFHSNENNMSDYDDPRNSDNSLYAQIRKPPIGGVAKPARV